MKNTNKGFLGLIVACLMASVIFIVQPDKTLNTHSTQLQALVIHCTATPENSAITANQVDQFFTRSVDKGGRGWSRGGYNDIIEKNGNVVNCIPYDEDNKVSPAEIANGACEYNRIARHVAYIGGLDQYKKPKNTMTPAQDSSLKDYIITFLEYHPNAVIIGHNQLANKACPSFNVADKLREYGIAEINIYKYKHRGKEIQLLNSADVIHYNINQSNIVQQEVLLSSISLHQDNRFKLGNHYPRSNQGYHNIHETRLGYNKCVA